MTYRERILSLPGFYNMKAPRDPEELYKKMGLPGHVPNAFIDALRDIEAEMELYERMN